MAYVEQFDPENLRTPRSPRTVMAWLFGMPLIGLVDVDGRVTVRLARRNAAGELFARRFAFGIKNVLLLPEGKVKDHGFVEGWFLFRDFTRRG